MSKKAKGLIPAGMSATRYRELLKVMNDPEYIGSEEIKRIEDHWKSYTEKKSWGNQESTPEKPTSTQDVAREDIKRSAENNTSTKKTTATEATAKTETKKTSTQDAMRESVTKTEKNVVEKKVKAPKELSVKKKTLELPDLDGSPTKMQAKIIKNAPKIMKGAALFIGTTSLLSTAMKMSEKSEQRAQVREMEKGVKEKVKKEEQKRKDYKVQDSYGNIDTSGIVMEMFEQRVGHHKMGNSRF